MGFFTSPAPPAVLTAFHPPLGVNPHYAVPQTTTLIMKEKVFSLSGDDFSIKDSQGTPVAVCRGSAFSLRDSKQFTSTDGRPLFTLSTKLFAIRKTFVAEDPSGKEIFRVQSKFGFGAAKLITTFVNATDGRPMEIELHGDFWGGSANLDMGGRHVANIQRKLFNAREFFGDSQSYTVTVAPGVDLVLIAAICICLDEKKNEH